MLGIRSGFYPWVRWGSLNAVHSVLGTRETRKGLYPSSTRLNCISVKGNNKGSLVISTRVNEMIRGSVNKGFKGYRGEWR
jgi:hypothetical protein